MVLGSRLAVSAAILMVPLALNVIIVSACSTDESGLSVFAAAGAKPPLDEICRKFGEQCENRVEISYGGGGEVLNQMILSRSGDVYIAPEQRFMEMALSKHAIDPETIKNIAYMVPVIAVKKGNPKSLVSLADIAKPGVRVAVTRVETTLLGKYAPEIFEKAGLAGAIGNNIVTEAARPDNLLTMLVMEQVDAGITWHFYQTQAPDQIEVVFLPPEQLTGIGVMQAAVSVYNHDKEMARRFIDFMTSADGKTIFSKHGYLVDDEEVKQYWH